MSSRCWQGHVPPKVQEGSVGLGLPPSSQEFLSLWPHNSNVHVISVRDEEFLFRYGHTVQRAAFF